MNSTELLPPTADLLSDLARRRDHEVVSLLLPPTPTSEARLTLRNLAKDAALRLEQAGNRPAAVRGVLAPVDDLLDRHELWSGPESGLSLYIDAEEVSVTPGPAHGSPLCVVAPGFQIKHLLAAVPTPDYAVLAVGMKAAHLYRNAGDGLVEVTSRGFPVAMDDVLRFDDREPQLQSHGSSRRGSGRVTASFHGQGGRRDQTEDVARYLRVVVSGFESVLDRELLVIAATDDTTAAVRRMSTYPHLLAEFVPGSADHSSAHELRRAALPIVNGPATSRPLDALRKIEAADAAHRTSDIGKAITAAFDGRVDVMVVANDTAVWGRYDADRRRIDALEAGSDDLLNLAAVATWLHGGTVFELPADEIAAAWPLVALLRY